MPEPAPRRKSNYATEPTFNKLIWAQQQETNKRLDRMENRMDKQDSRMDKLEAKIDKLDEKIDSVRKELNARIDKTDEKIDKLADKIDDLHKEIKSSINHGQIASISTIGIAIAVIYSLLR